MSEAAGEPCDLPALFDRYKERLRRTVRLRLDPRLTGIVDSSGVLKLAREEVDRRVAEAGGATAGSFLWLRQVVGEVMQQLHQQRLGPHLLGRGGTAENLAAARAEQKILLQETLNAMEPLDREVLTLRHCEQLSNEEAATVLKVSSAAASEAYIRALKRISVIVASLPGLSGKASK
jgi:RNA polymerase sigma-70 factor, ECF subfamily